MTPTSPAHRRDLADLRAAIQTQAGDRGTFRLAAGALVDRSGGENARLLQAAGTPFRSVFALTAAGGIGPTGPPAATPT